MGVGGRCDRFTDTDRVCEVWGSLVDNSVYFGDGVCDIGEFDSVLWHDLGVGRPPWRQGRLGFLIVVLTCVCV